MATNIGTLMATVGVDTRPLKKGLKDAEKQTKASTGRMLAHWKSMAAGIVATYILYKTVNLIKETALLAARFKTLDVVMKTVGKNADYSAGEMNQYDLALRKTGISMIKSRQSLTMMTQAQLDLTKAAELGRIAQDAAVIGNINSSEAFERMIYGIQSGNLVVLKTIGLNVSFEKSYQEVADATGRARKSFTETEKAIIRQNAVIKYGERIAGTYEAAMGTAGKKLTSFTRYVEDFKVKMGAAFSPATVIIVDAATQAMKDMQEQISKPETQEALRELSTQLAETIVQLGKDLPEAIETLASAVGALADSFSVLVNIWTHPAWDRMDEIFGTMADSTWQQGMKAAADRMKPEFHKMPKWEGIDQAKRMEEILAGGGVSRLSTALEDPDKYYGEMILQEKLKRDKKYYQQLEELARRARREDEEEWEEEVAETMRLREEFDYRIQIQEKYYESIEALAREAREEEEADEEEKIRMARETADYQKKLEEEKYGFMRDAMREWALDQASTLNEMLWGADHTFGEMAMSFSKMITEMLIKQAMLKAMSWGGGMLAAQGGVFDHGETQFASGGIVNRPTQFAFAGGVGLMGEAGPEAIMPLTRMPGGDLGVKMEEPKEQTPINIINVADPGQIDMYLASARGQDAIINVLGSRSQSIQRILR